MKSFSSFKQYVFTHLFPAYYRENDTYKDGDGKGILERFIEVCSEYLDTQIIPDIDNFMDILDVDKTPDIFLNYLWEYFGYIPYAYGILTRGEPYTPENVARWLNNPTGFPKADTRAILKYAISLYKIRCTDYFYLILGRFYGVRFELIHLGSVKPDGSVVSDPEGTNLVVATFGNVYSVYPDENHTDMKAGYYFADCWSCEKVKLNVYIPKGMYDILEELGRLDDVNEAFKELIRKYLPIHVTLDDGDVSLISDMPSLLISSPPIIPQTKSKANIRIPSFTTPVLDNNPPDPDPMAKLVVVTYSDKGVLYNDIRAGYLPPESRTTKSEN